MMRSSILSYPVRFLSGNCLGIKNPADTENRRTGQFQKFFIMDMTKAAHERLFVVSSFFPITITFFEQCKPLFY